MGSYTRQISTITLPLAIRAMEAAIAEAQRSGIRVSVCVVDASGQQILAAHMDRATLQCAEIARGKAITAVGYGLSTSAWELRLENRSNAVRNGLPLQAGLVLFGGGEPFKEGVDTVGAIGVSGGSEQQDVTCALAAAACVSELLGAR
ncbi:heme-binding protein [Pseudomonas putida]|uniref:GlcG/HbpS family heme-binding protein n=1 Tax=Pseudomonas putida TaxID=303 RepID=UPI0023645EAD|nr:heme-binding protein [Pseudomonas putida]MDD2067812.1 heme-binding protein [Pseudomonas putida]HDS1738301.1 heme-binding protein [Pseudomonas putida]